MLKENPLSQIRGQQLHEIAEESIRMEFALYWKYKGQKCKKCGVVQGKPKNGFKEFYCDYYCNKIRRKMRGYQKETTKFLGLYISSIFPEQGGTHREI